MTKTLALILALGLPMPTAIIVPPDGGGVQLPSNYRVAEDIVIGPDRTLESITVHALHWTATTPSQTGALVEIVVYDTDGVALTAPQSKMYDGSGSITFSFPSVDVPDTIVVSLRNRVPSRRMVWQTAELHDRTDSRVWEIYLDGQPIPVDCPLVDVAMSMTVRMGEAR